MDQQQEGYRPFKPISLVADYNMITPIDTKGLTHEDAKKGQLEIKDYSMLDTALSPETQSRVEACMIANTLWKALHTMCEGSDEIKAIK